jgi:hypothetical protein
VSGRSNPDSALIKRVNGKPVPLSEADGSFQFDVFVARPKSLLTLTAVDPYGKISTVEVLLTVRDWDGTQREILALTEKRHPSKRFHWNLAVGITHLDYSRTELTDVSSLLLSTHAAAEYWLAPGRWNLELSGYYTPVALTTSPSGYSIEFLGINARVGYVLPWIVAPWRLTLMAGAYYATTFTSSPVGGFGYLNIGGPEVYPVLSRTLSSGARVNTYFKFSPVSDDFTILTLANREIAAGLGYDFPPNADGQGFLVRFDWANLIVHSQGLQAESTTFSFGSGYRW